MQTKGKSQYSMRFSCHWQEIEYIIAIWLENNNFSYVEKGEKRYYVKGNPLTRRFFFEYYYVSSNEVTICTYCSNGNGRYWPIESKGLQKTGKGAMYIKSIKDLLGAIFNMSSFQYKYQSEVQDDYHIFADLYDMDWETDTEKKLGDKALYSMLIGVAGLVLLLFGRVFGILILLWGLSFCFDGLYSKNKVFSYIGFVTIGISLLIWFVMFIYLFL